MTVWRIRAPSETEEASDDLARSCGVPVSLARILLARGVRSAGEADRFLKPRLSDLTDPFALPGMPAAVDRIWEAITRHEPVVVYGDYDVDGVTATALMTRVLTRLGAQVATYLPSRMEEGYGLSRDALDRCIGQSHPRLIVTTDCGSSSREVVRAAHAAGIDVVITDHHEVVGEPAEAVALVNPKLGDTGPARTLAGVGVAFKVCHAVLKHGRIRKRPAAEAIDLRDYLDLVALGTIADVVPMRDENRILAHHGLRYLNGTHHVGLRALAEVAGVTGEMGAYHVGFVLGPRMNAAGRMGKADTALDLLLTERREHAFTLAAELEASNRDRRRIEADIMDAAIRQMEAYFDPASHFGIVVGETGWHVGVVGIVASRLSARYGRPAVVVGFDEDGVGRGSCRSVAGFDLMAGLRPCGVHLTRYGGHEKAAGLEVHRAQFEDFRRVFLQACQDALAGRDTDRTLDLDGWVTLEDVTDKRFTSVLSAMAPFGEGHPEPAWGVRRVRATGVTRVGGGKHLKFLAGMGASQCEAIGFGMGERQVPDGDLDLAFTVRQNTFLGRSLTQLHLLDFVPSSGDGSSSRMRR